MQNNNLIIILICYLISIIFGNKKDCYLPASVSTFLQHLEYSISHFVYCLNKMSYNPLYPAATALVCFTISGSVTSLIKQEDRG